jgi:hypothetical protein
MRSLDRHVADGPGAVELGMAVRIDDERKDFRRGRLDQDSPDDASRAGVDLGHG